MLLSKRPELFHPKNWPAYFKKAKDCNIWDLDGKKYFSLEQNQYLVERDEKVRNKLVQKILNAADSGGPTMRPEGRRGNRFESCDAFESYIMEGEEQ